MRSPIVSFENNVDHTLNNQTTSNTITGYLRRSLSMDFTFDLLSWKGFASEPGPIK